MKTSRESETTDRKQISLRNDNLTETLLDFGEKQSKRKCTKHRIVAARCLLFFTFKTNTKELK